MADKITPPPQGELAKPENPFALAARASQSASPYADLLLPTDSVLQAKGGIENLQIYRELLRDDQVASTFQQRRMAVTSKEWRVDPGADDALSRQAADALRENLQALPWDDITDKQLYATFFGWSVAEIIWRPDGERVAFDRIVVRDRARFRFGYSGALYLYTIDRGFVRMPERKFWTISTGADHNDEPYGLGLAHALYWPVFFKRNDIKFWLTFLERFGQPTAMAKLPAGQLEDTALKAKAIEMLKSIATDAGILVPDNVVVELLEATRSGSADYAGMKSAMDAAIAKIVLSQTMTTDDGSSRAQADVHKGVRDEVVKGDADLVNESFMRGPARWWTEWNFPGAAVPIVYRDVEPPEDLNALAERDTKVFSLGFAPTEDYIREKYGEGWVKKKEPDPTALPSRGMQAGPGAEFTEGEAAALQALRIARRGDQMALLDAAQTFAEQYDTIMGRRVGALLQAAEYAEDYETFRRRLDELLAETPPGETVDKLTRASFFARLLGAARAQRNRAA